MKKLIYILLMFPCSALIAQTPVDVAENTFKVGGMTEELFYYGFAEGDQIVFSFQEVNKKELKEIEIIELPGSSKFMDYKSVKVESKTIAVTQTGIYKFRFANSAIGGRVCKIKIQRIPASDATKSFNTSVYWKTVFDTTFFYESEEYLKNSDTSFQTVTDQVTTVHSSTNINGNKSTFNFIIPKNTVAWSYYIGVDQKGKEAYESASSALASTAIPILNKVPNGFAQLAALALSGNSFISKLQTGEDIDYYIVEGENSNLFLAGKDFYYRKKGKVINEDARMSGAMTGQYFFCLANDNLAQGVNVTIKILAVVVNNEWDTRQVKKYNIKERKEPYLLNNGK